jgi:hypothetical protein
MHKKEYINRLIKAAEATDLVADELGYVKEYPIIFLKPKFEKGNTKLVAAGFHGDESAPVHAILTYLENKAKNRIRISDLSFLPLINPTGFWENKRNNYLNEDPNRGFFSSNISVEGRILLRNLNKLLFFGKSGFLSLHEDIDQEDFYLYSFEKELGNFSKSLLKTGSNFFDVIKGTLLYNTKIENGIIFNHKDSSFEDFLFSNNVPITACTETPGKKPMYLRIQANIALIESFDMCEKSNG